MEEGRKGERVYKLQLYILLYIYTVQIHKSTTVCISKFLITSSIGSILWGVVAGAGGPGFTGTDGEADTCWLSWYKSPNVFVTAS